MCLDIRIEMFGPQASFSGRHLNLFLYLNRNDHCYCLVREVRHDSTQLPNPVSCVLPEMPAAKTPAVYLQLLMTSPSSSEFILGHVSFN